MGKYDGPSFYKKDHPKIEPKHGKSRRKSSSKYKLPDTVKRRDEIKKEAHQYMETPSYLNRRFRSTKIPNSLQHLDGWKNSRRNHQLIQELSERLEIASSDYLLFEEHLEEEPKQLPGSKWELLLEPEGEAEPVKEADKKLEANGERKADDEIEETSEAKDEQEAKDLAEEISTEKTQPVTKSETAAQPESKTNQPPHNPFTQPSEGVTLVRNDLVDLQFGPKRTKGGQKKSANKKPARKKATPVKQEKTAPAKQTKLAPVEQEKMAPVKQAKLTPVKQKTTVPAKQKKVKVVKDTMRAQKLKPTSGLHRSLSTIIADDKKAMKQWNSNLDSLFSDEKNL